MWDRAQAEGNPSFSREQGLGGGHFPNTYPQGAAAAPAGMGRATAFPGHLLPHLSCHCPVGNGRGLVTGSSALRTWLSGPTDSLCERKIQAVKRKKQAAGQENPGFWIHRSQPAGLSAVTNTQPRTTPTPGWAWSPSTPLSIIYGGHCHWEGPKRSQTPLYSTSHPQSHQGSESCLPVLWFLLAHLGDFCSPCPWGPPNTSHHAAHAECVPHLILARGPWASHFCL